MRNLVIWGTLSYEEPCHIRNIVISGTLSYQEIWGTLPFEEPCHMRNIVIWGTLSYEEHCHMRNIAIWGTLPFEEHCHMRNIAIWGTLSYEEPQVMLFVLLYIYYVSGTEPQHVIFMILDVSVTQTFCILYDTFSQCLVTLNFCFMHIAYWYIYPVLSVCMPYW